MNRLVGLLVLTLATPALWAHAREPRAPVAPSPEEIARASVAAAERRLAGVERALALEPPVRDVQTWAANGGRMEMAEARRLLADARAAGALPWIRLRGRFEDVDRLDRDEVGLVDKVEQDSRWTAELWLEWDLAEAVAGPGRLRAVKEVRSQLETRQAVVHQVTLAYHDRQRLLLEGALDPAEPDDVASLARRTVRTVRIRELDATLDALTGGRWAAALADLRPPSAPSPAPPKGPGPPPEPAAAAAVAGG